MPEVTWTKDGKPVQPSDRVSISCDGKKIGLEINPCLAKDSGQYACELRSPLGSDKSSANVSVRKINEAPSFSQRFSDLQQMMGTDAKFVARVSGKPQPEISWFFNDKPIRADGDKYRIKRDGEVCTLYVRNCTYADSGSYRCRASNVEGKADCEAALSVAKEL